MTDASAFLAAIIANPADDAPRLVYADWLDEQGDAPRATFIRAQIELARLPTDHPKRTQLIQTEHTLWAKHRVEWTAWVPRWAEVTGFHRGFLERIRCDAGIYLARADEVRLRTPLNGLRVDGRGEWAMPLFRGRAFDGLRSLILSVSVPREAWAHFGTCPYLERLEELIFNSKGPAADMVSALLESVSLTALRDLRLKWCALGDEQTCRLVRHKWVSRLRSLDLSNNHIADEGGLAIAESPHLDGLEVLNLKGNAFGADGQVAERLRKRFVGSVLL